MTIGVYLGRIRLSHSKLMFSESLPVFGWFRKMRVKDAAPRPRVNDDLLVEGRGVCYGEDSSSTLWLDVTRGYS